jgi:MFS family permease
MNLLSSFHAIGRAFRHPDFAIYAAGNVVSLIGTWMQRLAIGWLTWELTGSGAWLGTIAFADLFPTIIVGPIAGAIADRWNRLSVTRITQSLALCQSAILFVLTATGQINIWVLCVLTALGGLISAFNQPARLALVPSLVPRSDLVAAVAIVSIIFNLARFVGPAVAGVMIVSTGLAGVFLVNVLSFVVFLLALAFLRTSSRPDMQERPAFTEQVLEGMRYAAFHKGIGTVLLLTIVTSVCSRPVAELLPGFAAEVFRSGADGLAILTSTVGVGAVVGGFWLGGRTEAQGLTRVALVFSLIMAVAGMCFAATDRLWAAIPLLGIMGFSMSSSGIASQTLVQLSVPASMRGRVLSLYGLIGRGGPAVGALAMGLASERFGFRIPVALGGIIAGITAIWMLTRQARIAAQLEPEP